MTRAGGSVVGWETLLDALRRWHEGRDRVAASEALVFLEVELRLSIPPFIRRLWTAEMIDDALQSFLARLLDRWIARVAGMASAAAGASSDWVERVKRGLELLEPSPAMSGGPESAHWTLRGARPAEGRAIRAFVLQEAAPEETEVELKERPTDLWYMERPGERVLVVIVAGEQPIEGGSLAEVLRVAAGRGDVSVAFRLLTRPR